MMTVIIVIIILIGLLTIILLMTDLCSAICYVVRRSRDARLVTVVVSVTFHRDSFPRN